MHSHPFAGHYGIQRTRKKLQEVFYWPEMQADVEQFIRSCDSCQRVKARAAENNARVTPLDIPGRRWESVSMDFIMDLPVTQEGHDAIVVFVDRLSKMVHLAKTTKTVTAAKTADVFISEVVKHHGVPLNIVSDRDLRFQSTFWKEFCQRMRIDQRMSSRLHP